MKNILCLLFIFLTSFSYAQTFSSQDPVYMENVKKGEAALNEKAYDECLGYYRTAFKIKQTSVLSTLRMAACAFSGANKEEYNTQLNKAIELDWGTSELIFSSYPEFEYLKGSEMDVELKTRARQKAEDDGVNFELMEELAEINKLDQQQRQEMGNFEWGTPQMDSLWIIQNYSDSVNTVRMIEIIEEHGYPGKSLVGQGQMGTAFLVIQHADLEIQEKYLPVLSEAAEKGELRKSSLALLIDRVNLRQGKKQIYGSQIAMTEEGEHYLSPLQDPENINALRSEVGLGPIDDYCANWNFKFDIERHKKIWGNLEKKQKEEQK